MSSNKDLEQLTRQLAAFSRTVKTELDWTARAINNNSELDKTSKEFLIGELKNIEEAIANPDDGLAKIMTSIQSINHSFNANG